MMFRVQHREKNTKNNKNGAIGVGEPNALNITIKDKIWPSPDTRHLGLAMSRISMRTFSLYLAAHAGSNFGQQRPSEPDP